MKEMRLPVLDNDATVNDALEALKHRRCSALVIERASGPVVLDVDLILRALWQRGNVALSEIEPRLRTERVTRGERPSEPSHRSIAPLEVAESVVYLVEPPFDGEVVVLAPRETHAYIGAAPRLYGCPEDRSEVWGAHQLLQPGNRCRNHRKTTTFLIT